MSCSYVLARSTSFSHTPRHSRAPHVILECSTSFPFFYPSFPRRRESSTTKLYHSCIPCYFYSLVISMSLVVISDLLVVIPAFLAIFSFIISARRILKLQLIQFIKPLVVISALIVVISEPLVVILGSLVVISALLLLFPLSLLSFPRRREPRNKKT